MEVLPTGASGEDAYHYHMVMYQHLEVRGGSEDVLTSASLSFQVLLALSET